MLPSRLRLPRRAFSSLRGARREASPHFFIRMAPASASSGGCAVIISKKVARLSTTRHALKRRVFTVVRPWCVPGRVLIVEARPGSDRLPFPDLAAELAFLYTRLASRS